MGVTVIEEDYGDLIDSGGYDIICTTTNRIVKPDGRLVMGGGVAKIMLDRYKDIDLRFGQIVLKQEQAKANSNIQVVLLDDWPTYLVGFPTKIHFKNPSPPWLIERSMKQLICFKQMVGINKVLLPGPGAGLGGLDWETQVRPLIEKIPGVDESIHVCIKR